MCISWGFLIHENYILYIHQVYTTKILNPQICLSFHDTKNLSPLNNHPYIINQCWTKLLGSAQDIHTGPDWHSVWADTLCGLTFCILQLILHSMLNMYKDMQSNTWHANQFNISAHIKYTVQSLQHSSTAVDPTPALQDHYFFTKRLQIMYY